jgi:hypothetical protein
MELQIGFMEFNGEMNFNSKLLPKKMKVAQQTETKCSIITDYVTSYRFVWQPGFPCDFTVVVIDTPGFANTGGIKRDEEIVLQLKTLFETQEVLGVDRLHAVALVVPSSNVKLTSVQKHAFGAILSRFGRDIIENLLLMATFANGTDPRVLAAVRQDTIQFRDDLQFNNSALFARNSGDDAMARLFWDIGTQSYQKASNEFVSCNQNL